MKYLFRKFCSFLSHLIDFLRIRIIDPPQSSVNYKPKYHYSWGRTKTNYDYYKEDEVKSSYEYFKKYFLSSVFFLNTTEMRREIINKAIQSSLDVNIADRFGETKQEEFFLEFGVYNGLSTNIFAKQLKLENKKLFAFDSFEGLLEDQIGHIDNYKGKFNRFKKIPKLQSNVFPVVGWIQDTLPFFLKEKVNERFKIRFLHVDVDTYQTTKYILENLKKYLVKDSIILFDELYNMPGWSVGEYKALIETFSEDEYSFIGFSAYGEQVAIKINK
jgi:hypothetical protein